MNLHTSSKVHLFIGMLRYSRSGHVTRNFITNKIPTKRLNWEFYAVVNGRCAPTYQLGDRPTFKERTLWIMSPAMNYGWTGEDAGWERILFHFAFIPDTLRTQIDQAGKLEVQLSEGDIEAIRRIEKDVREHMLNPNQLSNLVFHRALIELSLVALRDRPLESTTTLEDVAYQRVEDAIGWYLENMRKAPTIEAVASAVNISTSHLRRHFHQIKHCSPNDYFQRLRMERACKLLNQTTDTLDEIARRCGFPNSSDFCRSFKKAFSTTPHTWRRRITTKNPFTNGIQIANFDPGDRRQDGHFIPKEPQRKQLSS